MFRVEINLYNNTGKLIHFQRNALENTNNVGNMVNELFRDLASKGAKDVCVYMKKCKCKPAPPKFSGTNVENGILICDECM